MRLFQATATLLIGLQFNLMAVATYPSSGDISPGQINGVHVSSTEPALNVVSTSASRNYQGENVDMVQKRKPRTDSSRLGGRKRRNTDTEPWEDIAASLSPELEFLKTRTVNTTGNLTGPVEDDIPGAAACCAAAKAAGRVSNYVPYPATSAILAAAALAAKAACLTAFGIVC